MSLYAGARLGPYEILSALGAGGMGEVYRARDTKLDREVALKVLPESFATDPERLARFEREAKTLAALNHPNIAHVHGLEDAGSVRALVMELVEGEDLSQRIARGAIPLDDALSIAKQLAEALEAAHEKGIVHRDLKPANIKVTPDGVVKVLDFGLAKILADDGPKPSLSQSPTVTMGGTREGIILGTVGYMSPEQARGGQVDKRTDIWAFGCVVYEMLTGRAAFSRATITDTLAAILEREPDWHALSDTTPRHITQLLHRCLEKSPRRRLRDIGEARIAIDDPDTAAAPVVPRASRNYLTWALGALAVAGFAFGALTLRDHRQVPATADAIEFAMSAPENSPFAGGGGLPFFAASPDGRQVAFVATTAGGGSMLFVRSLGTLAARPLTGTEQASYPFWSADSQSIGFFAAGKMRKVQIGGGSPIIICDATNGRGGTWSRDNVIVFAPTLNGALERVSASGGTPTSVTTLDSGHGETAHRWPSFLPDGQHFLYFSPGGGQAPSQVKITSLGSQEATTLLAAESMTTFASGHIFFWREGGMMAQPFDPSSRKVTGDPFRVAEPVGQTGGYATFSISQTGLLAYAGGGVRPTSQLTWVDRTGKQLGTVSEPGDYYNIALAPDERRVAVSLETGTPRNRDIWLIDSARSVSSRLTIDPAIDFLPTWSPNGARLLFAGAGGLYLKSSSGGGEQEPVMKVDELTAYPMDWSRDGKFLLYATQPPSTGFDLWVLPMTGDQASRKPIPFAQTPFSEDHGAFAPDGRWIAYTSNESGREEVYVQPFPAAGEKFRISSEGGTQPEWRGDGRELFFLAPDGTMMSASMSTGRGFVAGIPQRLFTSGVAFTNNRHQYAVTRDGQRFLVNVQRQGSSPAPLTVVINWQAGLKK